MTPPTSQSDDKTVTSIIRTPPSNFDGITFAEAYPARRIRWSKHDLDIHVVDAPAEGDQHGTFLLLHGEPSWSHLYAAWIPRLTAAGFRCVAPDLPGFGRSDKPTDDSWFSYERHCQAVRLVIDELDLRNIHLVVQDWGGPIGLRQAVDTPDLFARLFIFNTWLHHDAFEYSDGLRWWHEVSADPAHLGGDMPTGDIVSGTMRRSHNLDELRRVYDAPFDGIESKAGPRAFPAMLPFARPDVGGAEQQQRCHEALLTWSHCPVHIAFGDSDPIFTFEQAETWSAEIPGATLDRIEGAGHFVQADAPDDCLAVISGHLRTAI